MVVHYRVIEDAPAPCSMEASERAEEAQVWAERLVEKLRGLLREELAEYRGTDAFMKWIRSDEEDVG